VNFLRARLNAASSGFALLVVELAFGLVRLLAVVVVGQRIARRQALPTLCLSEGGLA
jgi:hypothetical protein